MRMPSITAHSVHASSGCKSKKCRRTRRRTYDWIPLHTHTALFILYTLRKWVEPEVTLEHVGIRVCLRYGLGRWCERLIGVLCSTVHCTFHETTGWTLTHILVACLLRIIFRRVGIRVLLWRSVLLRLGDGKWLINLGIRTK